MNVLSQQRAHSFFANPDSAESLYQTKPTQISHCLHELIEHQALLTPDAVALSYNGQTLSYAELNRKANQCAHYLIGLGVKPDTLVGVVMQRSLELPVALLAILKAGGAYLPLSVDYPEQRMALLLADAGVEVILTQQALLPGVAQLAEGKTLFCLDSERFYLEQEPETNPAIKLNPEHLAYVIYTSGSTGLPKGCMISHQAIVNRLLWMREQYRINADDTILQKTPYTFDVSVWEFFLPWLSGACLLVAKPEGHKDNAYLVELIQTQKSNGVSFCAVYA
ncbi:AMP-binding protein [Methylocucumis oryzae]|uniref:AMP-binding protein n=1 Tax=Methylocucumis oryzae TaxID=1632867 RepID=UPI00103C81FA|nr:AMP-binding protein [Methylocucumis oryzae]